jgi:hypothetical protein
VKDQSHKSEMGAALRGDFERLRARRQAGKETATAVPVPGPEVMLPERAAVQHGPASAVSEAPSEAERPAGAPAEPGRPSWLERLRGRA